MFSLIRLTLRRAREERLPQAAGGLTFTTTLSVVPLLVVSFALFTRLPAMRRVGEAIREHLLQGLLPPDISRTVLKHLAQFAANAGGLTLVGSLFVVASALVMLLTVENALNRAWQVKKNRPLHKRLGLYAVMLVVGLPLLGASLWGHLVRALGIARTDGRFPPRPPSRSTCCRCAARHRRSRQPLLLRAEREGAPARRDRRRPAGQHRDRGRQARHGDLPAARAYLQDGVWRVRAPSWCSWSGCTSPGWSRWPLRW
jgi:hypothetical protein